MEKYAVPEILSQQIMSLSAGGIVPCIFVAEKPPSKEWFAFFIKEGKRREIEQSLLHQFGEEQCGRTF